MKYTKFRGRIVADGPLKGACVLLVKILPTGRYKVEMLEERGAYKVGETLIVGPGEFEWDPKA